MQTYADFTGDYDGVEIVEGKVQGRCWDRALPGSGPGFLVPLQVGNAMWHIFLAMFQITDAHSVSRLGLSSHNLTKGSLEAHISVFLDKQQPLKPVPL